MGTTVRGVPWDVPVQLVDRSSLSLDPGDAPQGTTRAVDIGRGLPGVHEVHATTLLLGGRTLLTDIRPGPPTGRSDRPPGPPRVPLRDLLEELAVDGAVPVLVEGTPFAHDVLGALVGIPVGERCSYAELAARAGHPRAVRATAHVMATNRVPLVLPCHRVVRSDGTVGRHHWGDPVKRALLSAEA